MTPDESRKGDDRRTLSMKVPDALDRRLSKLAKRRGVSKSALVRDAKAEQIGRARHGGPLRRLLPAPKARFERPTPVWSARRRSTSIELTAVVEPSGYDAGQLISVTTAGQRLHL